MADEVRYDQRGRIALITLNRPRYANAQNSAMTYALDAAFARAVNDNQVAVLLTRSVVGATRRQYTCVLRCCHDGAVMTGRGGSVTRTGRDR